jgi:RimJ/RimL family protein N-acetyltransferase
MTPGHVEALGRAAADGRLWESWTTSVAEPQHMSNYVAHALRQQEAGAMLPWVVCDEPSDVVIGSTRYHDIVPEIDRVEIGHTWYARSRQRTHVNTACKLLLLGHAFDTLGCAVVGFRTDNFNLASQRAIEALGAQRDGVLRHHQVRKDGSARDTVLYSILVAEWPDVKKHLLARLAARMDPRQISRKGRT